MLDHKNPHIMDMEQIKSGTEAVFPEKVFFYIIDVKECHKN